MKLTKLFLTLLSVNHCNANMGQSQMDIPKLDLPDSAKDASGITVGDGTGIENELKTAIYGAAIKAVEAAVAVNPLAVLGTAGVGAAAYCAAYIADRHYDHENKKLQHEAEQTRKNHQHEADQTSKRYGRNSTCNWLLLVYVN